MSPTPHLDDELLSAHLDGEAPDAAGHLAACAECRARLDALGEAARLVATPPAPPSPAAVDAAVARALGEGSRANRRPMPAAIAAVAVAVLGIVGIGVMGDGGRQDRDVTALADRDEGASGGGSSGTAVTDGGDLGELADARRLADTVRAAVEPSTVEDESAEAASPTGGDAAAATGRPTELRATSGAKARGEDPYCEATVAETYAEGLGPLVYRATLRWDGTPAAVVVFGLAEPQGELNHRVYVLAVSDCRLLVAQTV